MPYRLLFASIVIAVIGQTLFKVGAQTHSSSTEAFWKVFLSPSVIFGLGLYLSSALLYIQALKTVPLSVAYPSLSLSYVIVVLISWLLFKEPLGKEQLFGITLIIAGVAILWSEKL